MLGWCFGRNVTTGTEGLFPVGCTQAYGVARLVVINIGHSLTTMIGYNQIEAAQISFPNLIEIQSFTQSQFSARALATVIDTNSTSKRIFVCGPVGMNTRAVDYLDELGLAGGVTMLGNSGYS
ncbi:hypothetical protein BC833DRAFT_647399 [Globomyces pollinis-pini]|nr:hypothetical protein BC833DRAFT_647399 [Globomyces pollinis-pini]